MKIDFLLERYFEGLTTADEEATLRCFFISDDVPEKLMMYRPLFVHFDNEINRQKKNETIQDADTQWMASDENPMEIPEKRSFSLGSRNKAPKSIILWLSGVAACAAIITGSFLLTSQKNKCPVTGDYVIIDGRCYTDASIIRSATFKTLHGVAVDGDFLPDNQPSTVIDMVENQLKEFDFLLDE